MAEELYKTWILSSVELNLCAGVLGYSDWYQIPIGDNGEPLEKRMLEGFLSLFEKKLLYVEDNAFIPTELMGSLVLPLIDPDEIIRESDLENGTLYFRKQGKPTVGLEKLQTEHGYYRLYMITGKTELSGDG